MWPHRAGRALTTLAVLVLLLLPEDPAGAAPKPTPSPFPLPAATSWVGGEDLISTRVLTDLPAGVRPPPAPKAASWLVADLDTREVLAAHRVHVPLAPASTLKIFTALALTPRLPVKHVYTARDDDAAVDGTKVGLVPGSRYTVDQLVHGMIMASGNDCANALGNLAGGQAQAQTLIQAEARRLGAFDTLARTTSGLDAPGQVSSAYDLALAGAAALEDPQLARIMKTTAYPFPGAGTSLGRKRSRFQIQSHNRLLRNVPGADGVKNGYTDAARGSFVGSATRNGHHYITVVMRAEGNTWHESRDLLEWAFAAGPKARPVGRLVTPGELPAMIGPTTGDGGVGLGATGGSPAPSPPGGPGTLHGALPVAGTSLSSADAGGTAGDRSLIAACLALALLAGVLGGRWVAASARPPASSQRHRS
jgi:serine-type D-Ala-D-Ala carboxypeptidase (penicillin-binding protein 5/6)